MIFFFIFVVHGGWSGWSSWLPCDNTCGGGTRERKRSCTNPPPYFGGKGCGPHHYESEECALNKCPGWLPSFYFRCLCFRPSICMSFFLSFGVCQTAVYVCPLVLLGQFLRCLFIWQSSCLVVCFWAQLFNLLVCFSALASSFVSFLQWKPCYTMHWKFEI